MIFVFGALVGFTMGILFKVWLKWSIHDNILQQLNALKKLVEFTNPPYSETYIKEKCKIIHEGINMVIKTIQAQED